MKDRRKNFVRLAEKRVNTALKHLRLIGNLSNTSNYVYTQEEVDKIFNALRGELKRCKKEFVDAKPKKFDLALTKQEEDGDD